MRDLKILFIDDIEKKLSYPIHELKKEKNGYYTIHHAPLLINENLKEYISNNDCRFCYIITPENRILEYIYADKVHVLRQSLENLYEFKENELKENKENEKIFSKIDKFNKFT